MVSDVFDIPVVLSLMCYIRSFATDSTLLFPLCGDILEGKIWAEEHMSK